MSIDRLSNFESGKVVSIASLALEVIGLMTVSPKLKIEVLIEFMGSLSARALLLWQHQ